MAHETQPADGQLVSFDVNTVSLCQPQQPPVLCDHPGTGQTLLFAPADGHGVKKSRLTRDRDRDISEKIALGQAAVKPSGEGMYDQRLFNQDSGMQHLCVHCDLRVLPEGGTGGSR